MCGKQHVTKSLVICSNKKFGPKIKMARNEKLDKYLLFRLNVISLFIGVQSYGQEDPRCLHLSHPGYLNDESAKEYVNPWNKFIKDNQYTCQDWVEFITTTFALLSWLLCKLGISDHYCYTTARECGQIKQILIRCLRDLTVPHTS